jgi:hypothetical protein
MIAENLKIGTESTHNVEWWVYECEWYRKPGSKRALILGNWVVDRNVIQHGSFHNLVTNAGKAATSNRILGLNSQAAYTYLAIGTGSTAVSASQTALVTELSTSGLARASATVSSEDNGSGVNCKMQWDKTWTKGDAGSVAVAEAGIFDAASAGTMLSRVLVGPATVAQSQQYRLLWTNTLS